MTNPGNIVRVRARTGGRASVYEANAWAQAFTSGVLDGVGVIQNTSADLNVIVGGSSTKPDVVLAQNPAGYKIALDLVGQQVIPITAPASNTRITSIVAYTDDLSLSTSEDSVTGSPSSCGLIAVNGTAAAVYNPPTDSDIRAAITADGATGSQASYAVLANITMSAQTDIITDEIISVNYSHISNNIIGPGAIGSTELASGAVQSQNVDYASLLRFPVASTDVLTDIGNITSTQYYTVPNTGFLCGKACAIAPGTKVYVTVNSDESGAIAGILYKGPEVNNIQVGFSVPVRKGDTIAFVMEGGCQLQGLRIRGIRWVAVS